MPDDPTRRLKPLPDRMGDATAAPRNADPEHIGPYQILELLGEGGMGRVYLAEQREPVRRRVALKVIKLGMDSRAVLQRFQLERQALAVMNHDNIARVIDAGTTERGQPYFCMEHVPGIPLTTYCDQYRLTVEDRIRLFEQVCAGVQHAHQKGVIHRDLKPGNVLVSEQQGRAIPKIIDFGLARATDHMLLQATVFTEQGDVIGTPEYMAPEQLDPSEADIDTRADVYSLGVMLYELLAGGLPFTRHELRDGGQIQMRRVIREVEPRRPSTRLSAAEPVTVAAITGARRTTRAALLRCLRTDLDWIALRAMEKDRNRRYGSASELAQDLGRCLRHEPVLAGPPRAGYRLRKFLRRYRGQVAAAVALFAMMVIAIVGVATQWARADQKAAVARAVSAYLQDLFSISDPSEALGNRLLARDVLDRGARRILTAADMPPAVRSELMQVMGQVYSNLGLFREACSLLEPALELRRELFGRRSLEVAETLQSLGSTYFLNDRNAQARDAFAESLAIRSRILPENDLLTADSCQGLAGAHFAAGDFPKAEEHYGHALAIRRAIEERPSEQTAGLVQCLTFTRLNQAPRRELLAGFEDALRIYADTVAPNHPSKIDCLNNYGWWLNYFGEHERAEAWLRQALELNLAVRETGHPAVAACRSNLASSLLGLGRAKDAREHAELAVSALENTMPSGSLRVALARNTLGAVLSTLGEHDRGGQLLEQSHAVISSAQNRANLRVATLRMAQHYERTGDVEKARAFRRQLE